MALQRNAREAFASIADPSLAELASQAMRLAENKMTAYWDLLSLQDPFAPPATSKRPKALSVSIKEYELVEPIGTGGFGTVWLARRRRTGDLSAIKVISQEDTRRRKMNSAVLLEKTILAQADHPCVVKLLFSFATPRHLYMVMEFMPGGDCLALVQKFGFLEEDLSRWFVAEALLGLQYLHSVSVIHRDIKPSNMLITAEGHIKLTDFGLSTADERDDSDSPDADSCSGTGSGDDRPAHPKRLYLPTGAVGTPDYLAPELLERKTGYSYEVDFWALGAVLYQFLVGETPFSAPEVKEVYRRILAMEYDPLQDCMSEEAHQLISSLLVADPSQRLGGGQSGVRVIVSHAFFAPVAPVDEPALWQRPSPFVPYLKHEADTSHFDMTELTKAQAERMRCQLEGDHDTFTNMAREIRASLVPEEEANSGNSDDDGGDDSFKTANVEALARMQLQEASEGAIDTARLPRTHTEDSNGQGRPGGGESAK
jgi:serine/threonine protein kinase